MGILNEKIPFCSTYRKKRCKMCKTRHSQGCMYDKKGRWGSDYRDRIFPLLFVGKYCSKQCFELDNPGKVVESDQLTKAGEKAMKAREKEAATAATAATAMGVPTDGTTVVSSEAMAQVQAASQAEFDSVVVLKRYKKLLDEGVITQEDFDAKKKEILKI